MRMCHRPALECLESRLVPAVLQDIPTGDAGPARLVVSPAPAPLAVPPVLFPGELAQLKEAIENIATAVNAETASESGQVFFSTPVLPDPLLAQIGRLKEQELKFPASGGGGGTVPYEEYLPSTAPPGFEPAVSAEAPPEQPEKEEAPAEEQAAPVEAPPE
jgi:hypothetical protein